jgi:hypothetical protein
VTTTVASTISCSTASSGGAVINDGGSPVTARGVCWNTSPNPTIANNKTNDGTGTGTFRSGITGLSLSTVYYYRAYATNSVATSYGSEYSFKTAYFASGSTSAATGVTCNSAILGGTVASDGGDLVFERGIVYATTPNPTTFNTKVPIGSGGGTFSQTVTGLSGGTTYYVREYAINCAGTAYGIQVSFNTLPVTLANVTTATPSSVGTTVATLGGNVTSEGGSPVTDKGIVYATTQNPTISNYKVSLGSGMGSFSSVVSGFACNTTYYVRAYATNCGGTNYGGQATITTSTCVPNFYIYDSRISDLSPARGQTIIAATHIINNGTPSTYSPYVGYYISTDSNWSPLTDYLGQETQVTISPATKNEFTLEEKYTIPTTVPVGTYYLLIVIDNRKQYSEGNESDNVFVIKFSIN